MHLFVKHEPKASASYVANRFKGFTTQVREECSRTCVRGCRRCGRSSSSRRGVVCTETIEKYINTRWDRPWTKKQREEEGGRAPRV